MIAKACPVPTDGLLAAYAGQGATYTDCFEAEAAGTVTLPQFIQAFYTTWLFRLERFVLMLPLRRRVRDAEVTALAQGAERFAVWRVEARREDQILLCDLGGHTRSFLAVTPAGPGKTLLRFGSAVVAPQGKELGLIIRLTVPLHEFYSKALLGAALRAL